MSEVTINTLLGPVKGLKQENILDTKRSFFSFRSIPYAQPPVADLRFRPPQPCPNWEGTLDATEDVKTCAQIDLIISNKPCGSDDCLYLNVFTLDPNPQVKRPVMVFIHGGGFTFGSSSTSLYGPDFLVDKDIVLVTINYRLNIFGFLNLGLEECPGNVGLKDIIAALKWVKKNISSYGGDANNVTLFGESAGAAAIHYILMALPARGLFHKAILQSGCAMDSWASQPQSDNMANGVEVARRLGCKSTDLKIVLEYLKSKPTDELVAAQEKSLVTLDKIKKTLIFPFVPCIETVGAIEDRVVPDLAINLVKQVTPSVPIIIGINSQESLILLKNKELGPQMEKTLAEVENDFERTVPLSFNVDYSKEKIISPDIKHFFFGNKTVCLETIEQYFNLYTDIMFTLGHYQTLLQYSQLPSVQIYSYLFTYEGSLNVFKNMSNITLPGACHFDEIGYMFYMTMAELVPEPGSSDEATSRNLCTLWTNFAKTGVPSTDQFNDWTPCKGSDIKHLEISSQLSLHAGFVFPERFDFWKKLHSKFSSKFLQAKI